jgi:hypothetical protein
VRGPPFGRPLGLHLGLGCKVRVPRPIADALTDDLEPSIAITLFEDPQVCGLGIFGQMQKLCTAPEIQQHSHLTGLWNFRHFKAEVSVRLSRSDGGKECLLDVHYR